MSTCDHAVFTASFLATRVFLTLMYFPTASRSKTTMVTNTMANLLMAPPIFGATRKWLCPQLTLAIYLAFYPPLLLPLRSPQGIQPRYPGHVVASGPFCVHEHALIVRKLWDRSSAARPTPGLLHANVCGFARLTR